MNHQRCRSILFSISFVAFVSCTTGPHIVNDSEKPRTSFTEEDEGRQITVAAAKKIEAHNFVEIKFDEGSAVLSQSAASSLAEAIDQAKQLGPINQIIVLSWSDQEYPSKKLSKLTKKQMSLADQRNKSIKKYFNSMNGIDAETHNMAERPTAFSKWFNTTDTQLKNTLIAAGLPTTGDALQYPSKASHSVILIKVD